MSGHSKWATTKRAKAIIDAKRSSAFTKLSNNITIAAKEGGGDPTTNFKLRLAMDKARQFNMPKDNIERAVKRGTGELGGATVEEVMYGALLPHSVAVIIKCLTDNKNRTLNEVKILLQKNNAQLTDLNSIAWQFENRGVIHAKPQNPIHQLADKTQEELELAIIDAGAEDFHQDEDEIIIYTNPKELQLVKEKLEIAGLAIDSADLEMVPKEKVSLEGESLEKIIKIFDLIDELSDLSDYYTNLE
ncbi:YebC/PmpR family DNA-binding transcriptional regulator [Candidatus Kuenenbacteria bacterium]|nr:YebC/PmpR family DNA-binding transcriptional regulator [Candidatus Kuenenbacteria bacterium]